MILPYRRRVGRWLICLFCRFPCRLLASNTTWSFGLKQGRGSDCCCSGLRLRPLYAWYACPIYGSDCGRFHLTKYVVLPLARDRFLICRVFFNTRCRLTHSSCFLPTNFCRFLVSCCPFIKNRIRIIKRFIRFLFRRLLLNILGVYRFFPRSFFPLRLLFFRRFCGDRGLIGWCCRQWLCWNRLGCSRLRNRSRTRFVHFGRINARKPRCFPGIAFLSPVLGCSKEH